MDYTFDYGKDPRKDGKYKTKHMDISEMMDKLPETQNEDKPQEETNEKD